MGFSLAAGKANAVKILQDIHREFATAFPTEAALDRYATNGNGSTAICI